MLEDLKFGAAFYALRAGFFVVTCVVLLYKDPVARVTHEEREMCPIVSDGKGK